MSRNLEVAKMSFEDLARARSSIIERSASLGPDVSVYLDRDGLLNINGSALHVHRWKTHIHDGMTHQGCLDCPEERR